jgi:hypothetical protein
VAALVSGDRLSDAIDRQIKGTPDERLVEDCCYDVQAFVAKFGKPEPAANDGESVDLVKINGVWAMPEAERTS